MLWRYRLFTIIVPGKDRDGDVCIWTAKASYIPGDVPENIKNLQTEPKGMKKGKESLAVTSNDFRVKLNKGEDLYQEKVKHMTQLIELSGTGKKIVDI